MKTGRLIPLWLIILALAVAACSGGQNTPEATATLRGAIVPTRVSPTPTDTPTNTPTATINATATANAISTQNAVATLDTQATQDAQETATANAIATENAAATADMQATLTQEAIETATANAIATQNSEATQAFQATLDTQAMLDTQATETAISVATQDAAASLTAEAIATNNAQATLDSQATADAITTGTAVAIMTQNARTILDAQATANAIATQNQQAILDAQATADALSVATSTPGATEAPISGNVLNYGDVATGEINNETFLIEYSFVGTSGDTVTIDLESTSGNLDPFLVLVGPQGNELISNDDGNPNTRNSRIMGFSLPDNGTYTIRATRFSQAAGTTEGNFRLSLRSDVQQPVTVRSISYGETISGLIEPNRPTVAVEFEAEEGDTITIEMRRSSGTLDPFIILRGPGGRDLITVDDDPEGGTQDAVLRDFLIPATGTYTIIATRRSSGTDPTIGGFNLTLTEGQGGPITTPPNQLTYNQTVQGEINQDQPEVVFTFSGAAGDLVNIRLNALSGDLDPLLLLLGPDGNEVARNDDDDQGDADNLNSYIRDLTLPVNGPYTIVATRFNRDLGLSSGTFELSLESDSAGPPPTREPVGGTPIPQDRNIPLIAYGDTMQGEINNQFAQRRFAFIAEAGDVISIRMNALSGDLDSLLALQDPNGVEIFNNDDDEEQDTLNSYIRNFTIPESGRYVIIATRFNRDLGESSGEFEIILEQVDVGGNIAVAPPGNIEIGSTVTGQITQVEFYQVYTFDGQQNQTVSVTLDQLTNDLDPYLMLLAPNGRILARNDDRSDEDYDSTLDNIILPETGQYRIVATRYNKNFGITSGAFELALTESSGETEVADITEVIEVGSTTTDTITADTPEFLYTFRASAGDVINIEMRSTDEQVDSFLELEDQFGRTLARNDDNVLDNNISNSALSDVVLPLDGFYVIIASSYEDGEGNVSTGTFELTLNGAGRVDPQIIRRGIIDPFYSQGNQSNGDTVIYYAAGDWTSDSGDTSVYSLLTFYLPPAPETIDRAILDLDNCYRTDSGVFDMFGGTLTAYLNKSFRSNLELTEDNVQDAPAIGTLEDCGVVDITEPIRAAYAQGNRIVQFRLEFTGAGPVDNDAIDTVIFVNPILEITTGGN